MCHIPASCRAHRSQWSRWGVHALGYGILLALLGGPVRSGERLELEDFSVYAPQPKIELDLDDGSTCSVTDRSPATLVFYGRQLNSLALSNNTNSLVLSNGSNIGTQSDLGGGVALMIPLGGTGFKKTCSGLLRLQEARAKIALAEQLLEAGQISEAEMSKVVSGLRGLLGI
jgi:hypothetical protein